MDTIMIFNILLFITLLYISYLQIKRMKIKNKVKELKNNKLSLKGSTDIMLYKFNLFKKFIGLKSVKKIDDKLKRCGNPFEINVSKYYIFKLISLIFIIYSIITGTFIDVLRLLIVFFAIDIYLYIFTRINRQKVYIDLFYVVQSLYLQMSAGVSLKDGLRNVNILCKNKKFKESLIILSTTYELSGYDIKYSTKEFEKQFDMQEIKLFSNALNQQVSSSVSIDMLANLYLILKNKYIERLNSNSKIKVIYITLGVLLILGNICLLVMFPIFMEVLNSFKTIFT